MSESPRGFFPASPAFSRTGAAQGIGLFPGKLPLNLLRFGWRIPKATHRGKWLEKSLQVSSNSKCPVFEDLSWCSVVPCGPWGRCSLCCICTQPPLAVQGDTTAFTRRFSEYQENKYLITERSTSITGTPLNAE